MRGQMKSFDSFGLRTGTSGQPPRAMARSGSVKVRKSKSMNNIRLTIFCGIVTVLVLRGTLGTRFLFTRPRQETDSDMEMRLLTEENMMLDEDLEADKDVPFALGAPIKDWDEKRVEWIATNRNLTKNKYGRDRILLVSGSESKPCLNPIGDHIHVKSLKNKIDYCRLHDIDIFYNMAMVDQRMTSFWMKYPMIRKLMLMHPEAEWIWWMDSDAMFTDMTFELPIHRYEDYNMVIYGFDDMLFDRKSWVAINAGSFLMRNCQWSLDLLEAWTALGDPRTAPEVGKMLSHVLPDRPEFDSDDQSALAYLLVTQTQRWAPKVFIENSYYLLGHWVALVDRFEEMMTKHKPDSGDDNWPFVTHFVGCQPCGNTATYGIKRCLQQMERAFNFGDNQILQHYGYMHRTLNSSREVGRIRIDSVDPLGLGPLPNVSAA